MGLDINGTRFLLVAKQAGVDFSTFAMIGRQQMHLTAERLKFLLGGFGISLDINEVTQLLTEDNQYSEPFLRVLGATVIDSFDASEYEKATCIHDMNLPISKKYKDKYTTVLDGGSLEHVFNFPVAIKNCMEMIKVGGNYLGITPANNFMGHGFYQFSPELYYRIFTAANGFELINMFIFENRPDTHWAKVPDPEKIKKRVELINNRPTSLLVHARKLRKVDIFKVTPQQSDYFVSWKKA